MRNFEKNAKRITKAVAEFVAEEFKPLREGDKIKKIGELLKGFEDTKKINGNFFVVLRLPEGIEAAIDLQGRLYDLNKI